MERRAKFSFMEHAMQQRNENESMDMDISLDFDCETLLGIPLESLQLPLRLSDNSAIKTVDKFLGRDKKTNLQRNVMANNNIRPARYLSTFTEIIRNQLILGEFNIVFGQDPVVKNTTTKSSPAYKVLSPENSEMVSICVIDETKNISDPKDDHDKSGHIKAGRDKTKAACNKSKAILDKLKADREKAKAVRDKLKGNRNKAKAGHNKPKPDLNKLKAFLEKFKFTRGIKLNPVETPPRTCCAFLHPEQSSTGRRVGYIGRGSETIGGAKIEVKMGCQLSSKYNRKRLFK